jgi:hypothetical protein
MRPQEPQPNANGWNNVSKGNSKRRKQETQQFSVSVRNSFSVLNEVADETQSRKAGSCLNINAVKKGSKLMFYSDSCGHDIPTSLSKKIC